MVRKVGFGDDGEKAASGPVHRTDAAKGKPAATASSAEETARAMPVSGRPRWGGIIFLASFLVPWTVMIFLVATAMLTGEHGRAGLYPILWLVLAVLGAFVLLRKIRHFYRGGTWLQTPEEAARKSADKTA